MILEFNYDEDETDLSKLILPHSPVADITLLAPALN